MATIFERTDFLIGTVIKLLFFARAGNFLTQSGYAVAQTLLWQKMATIFERADFLIGSILKLLFFSARWKLFDSIRLRSCANVALARNGYHFRTRGFVNNNRHYSVFFHALETF